MCVFYVCGGVFVVVFFKPKTAYDVRISDWSSDVCSSDLPALKPERAFGGDASVEWYFAPSSLLSASGFYRKVKDTLFDSTSIVGDDRYNFNGVDRSGYTYTTTLNGGDGKLYGIELRSEEHTSELQSLMRTSYAVFCLQ